ncbi:MAG: diguanylate cyclase [Nitrospirota bacterium]
MTIRSKIWLLSIIPILALLYFISVEIGEAIKTENGLKEVYDRILEAEKFSDIIHELQKERGLSSGFLTSKGKKFRDDLLVQRAETDRKIKDLYFLVRETGSGSKVMSLRSELDLKRNRISSLGINALEAQEYYTGTIAALINEVSKIALMAKTSETKNAIMLHSYLLYAKEFLGQIRATLNAVFAAGQFDGFSMRKLASIKGAHDTNTERFLQDAPPDVKRFYTDKFQSSNVQATMDMIDIAFAKFKTGSFGIDPGVWFKSATASINALKEVEDYCMGQIKKNTAQHIRETRQYIYAQVVMLGAILISVITTAMVIGKTIIDRLHALLSSITNTMNTGDFAQYHAMSSKDEIGIVSKAFNDLLKTTNQLIIEKEQLAETDPLTKIYNRLKFDNIFTSEIMKVQRYGTPLSLIMFDIDDFKQINDTYGHNVGDNVLIEITKIVSNNIRTTDIFARWGGEEFVILTPNTDMEHARELSERLRAAIEDSIFKKAFTVTCSFGVAEFREDDTTDTLSKRADDALYEAKKSGKNRVCIG